MGKKLRQQRAGRGTSTFISPSWRKIADVKYPNWLSDLIEEKGVIKGTVEDIVSETGRDAPLCLIKLENGASFYNISPENIFKGDEIQIGKNTELKIGNICEVGSLPEGTVVFNVERRPGDGGKLVRSAGTYSTIVSQTLTGTIISLPSGKMLEVDKRCLATIGLVASSGKSDKPLLKAGKSFYKYKAKAKKWPTVRGKAMYAASHPHGGGAHPKGGRVVKKTAPPGQKVGFYGSKRTGRRKG
ncbi:MAG: 50S ribosomal protein L2 [Thermoproteota archaeon]|jgi:LSU ribosomal protein L2P